MDEKYECARCKRLFAMNHLHTLEIANEHFRQIANAPGVPLYVKNETLSKMGLDTSMIFCDDCKKFLDDLLKSES